MADVTGGDLLLKLLTAVERMDANNKDGFAEVGRQLGGIQAWMDRVDISMKGLSTDVRRLAHIVNGLADQGLAQDGRLDDVEKKLAETERLIQRMGR